MRSFPRPSRRGLRCLARLTAASLAALVVGCGGTKAEDSGARVLRVLFVGNSLTATNDLPALVSAVAARVASAQIEYGTVAPGGVSLAEHWSSTGARALLETGRWDFVVLQQGPSTLPESRTHLRRWARRWADEARSQGTEAALLAVWPDVTRSSAFSAAAASYAAAAAASGARLLPASSAWRNALRRMPDLELYGPDGFHPSQLGTYLTALVVVSGLTDTPPPRDPVDVPALGLSISDATAALLARAVADARG